MAVFEEAPIAYFHQLLANGTDARGVVLELRRRVDGRPLWVRWWCKPEPTGNYTRSMFMDITDQVLMEQEKARLEAQNTYLLDEIRAEQNFGEIVGGSSGLKKVMEQVGLVAPTDATVLITGESGTGKELVAREIHLSRLMAQVTARKVRLPSLCLFNR
jgi:formate hydrogenlyase transcriptional activator